MSTRTRRGVPPSRHGFPMARGGGQDLPRARTLPTAKASRHGAKAKEFVPTREHAPRRRPPDTAHGRKGLPRVRTLPTAKASRHGARAKGFVPRENALLGEGLPTRRTSERVCPAQKRSPRRRPPDTAHERKDLPAQEHAPRQRPPDTAHERKDLPRGSSPSPHVPTNGGPPSVHRQPKNTPSAGSHPRGRGRCRVHSH